MTHQIQENYLKVVDFTPETLEARRQLNDTFKELKYKKTQKTVQDAMCRKTNLQKIR